ncbi:MAG: hypothetical protein HKM87_05390, partial [Ignavibacteriaceae bacterium]|nr:hypothetical protein [Ignavibacteriaceae bacterium]
MKNIVVKFLSIAIPLGLIFLSGCNQSDSNKTSELEQNVIAEEQETTWKQDREEIKAVLEKILSAVGNRNIKVLDDLTYNKAILGWTYIQDGVWLNKEMTMEEYLRKMAEDKEPKPISEIAKGFDITITEGQMAVVIAETIISQFGVPRSREVNHIIMMKEKVDWKLFSVAWTVERLSDEESKFDLELFARSYAQVWGSKRQEFVAMFFEENGSLRVNDGEPAVGREQITKVAKGFMTDLPDMIVSFDSLVNKSNGVEFHWTLTATHS